MSASEKCAAVRSDSEANTGGFDFQIAVSLHIGADTTVGGVAFGMLP